MSNFDFEDQELFIEMNIHFKEIADYLRLINNNLETLILDNIENKLKRDKK